MFWKASLSNIVPEQFVRWSHMTNIKTGCLFCHQAYRGKGREKDHQDITCMSFFSQHYILIMQLTTYTVQTVQSVELVRAEPVSDSSKQWSLIKIQNLWVKLF